MRQILIAGAVAGLVAAHAFPFQTAGAAPLAGPQASAHGVVELVAQKSRDDDDTPRASKAKAKRVSKSDEAKKTAPRYGSQAPGTNIAITPRGAYLYGPSFNGAYTPPAGYSLNGYPIRYADEVAAAAAECSSLRRRAMSSGRKSLWDRYYASCKDE